MIILAFLTRGVKAVSALILACGLVFAALAQDTYIRLNQAGYLPVDPKTAIVISKTPVSGGFTVANSRDGKLVFAGRLLEIPPGEWGGKFTQHYQIDFTPVRKVGDYVIKLGDGAHSPKFSIGYYPPYQEDLLFFMRQQRCGYNPYLGVYCHQKDGKTFYGPMPDGTVIDATGGWHDAGDQLKYLITASNATARMMLAYELEKDKFADKVDALGFERPNGIPDVLD